MVKNALVQVRARGEGWGKGRGMGGVGGRVKGMGGEGDLLISFLKSILDILFSLIFCH
jgi:hypothetical protein